MKMQSTAIALLCSIMAVTQLSGCEMVQNALGSNEQTVDYSEVLARSDSFFSSKPSAINIEEISNTLRLEYVYGDYFSITETYTFENNAVQTTTIVYPGEISTVPEFVYYTNNTLSTANLQATISGAYKWTGEPLLIPGIANLDQEHAVALAEQLKQEVDNNPGIPPDFILPSEEQTEISTQEIISTEEDEDAIVLPSLTDNGLSILEYSDNTLTMDKYAIHVGIDEERQITIAQCPKNYVDKLVFISDNPTIASVDSKGVVRGRKNGSATITVTVDGAAGYSSIMVYVY